MTSTIGRALLGLAGIIIIGGGAYFLLKPAATNAPAAATTETAPSSAKSLKALVAAGSPVVCTYATTTVAGTTNGKLYIANGMVAGDFTSATKAGTIDSHIMVRDNTSYVWSSMSTVGFKSTITTTNDTAPNGKSAVDYNAEADYSCSAWTPDSSKFNLPSNITFTSTASYTQPSQGAGATGAAPSGVPKGSAAQCAQCDSLPSAQKAQCLAMLQC